MGFFGQIVQGGGDTEWNGIITVDAVNGSDATGERNIINKPFQTLDGAYAVYQEGDLIRVLPGTYIQTATLVMTGFENVYWEFFHGAKVSADIAGPIFNSTDTTMNIHYFGYGEFENTRAGLGDASITGFSGRTIIRGAKSIIVESGTIFNNTVENSWLILEDIDEMYSKTAYSIQWGNNDLHDGITYGVIRNCKKVGDLVDGDICLLVDSDDTTRRLFVENSNFFGSGNYASFANSVDNRAKFVDCMFKVADGNTRSAYVSGLIEYENCHFQNNGNIETVWIKDEDLDNDPLPIFRDCSIRNNGSNVAVQSRGPAQWHGTNRLYGNQAVQGAIAGFLKAENHNTGTIIVNKTDLTVGNQIFRFTPQTTPPTVGDQYVITEPGGDTISYTVVALDTIDDIILGLESAWNAKITAEILPWKNWTPIAQLLPTGKLQATANDQQYNMDPDDAYVPSVIGTDGFTRDEVTTSAFAIVGPGKFLVDDNLVVSNI